MTATEGPPAPIAAARRRPLPAHLLLAAAAILGLAGLLAACGRSAPEEALDDPGPDAEVETAAEGGPDIAGVSITSPDAVIDPSANPGDPLTTPPAGSGEPQGTYTVIAGDTLWVIAARYEVSVEELAAANGITDVNDLSPGQELTIPAITPVEVTVVDASEQTPPEGSGGS